MSGPIRRIASPVEDAASYLTREWLVTNGQGGYASGTVAGVLTRRYHGVLVAALPAPIGRIVMLSAVEARLRTASDQVLGLDPQPSLIEPEPLQPPDRTTHDRLGISSTAAQAGIRHPRLTTSGVVPMPP